VDLASVAGVGMSTRAHRARRTVGLIAGLALAAPAALAQQQHVLVITGLGGEPAYRTAFLDVATRLHDVATGRWNVPDSNVIVLTGDASLDTKRIRGRSTREAVGEAFLTIAQRARPGDVVTVFLHGHGSGQGAESRVNLPGPDPTAAEYAAWIGGFTQQTVVFVNAASASGDFTRVLAGSRRLVLTATRSAVERNETRFAGHFVHGLESLEADANKDGRVTVLEAFEYARRAVEREYAQGNRLLTEHAVLSDATLAATVMLGVRAAAADPRVAALVAERQALEEQVAALRARKPSMAEAAYEAELERLLVAIAEKSAAIRAAGGSP
jgi:hypothetical protein